MTTLRRNLIVIMFAVAGLALVLVVVNKINRTDEEAFFVENAPRLDLIPTAPDTAIDAGIDSLDDKSGNDGRTFAIAFPDGEVIRVQKRARPRLTRHVQGRVIDAYDALRRDAENGDSEAAYLLGMSLRSCGFSAPTQESLETAIDQAYQTRTYEQYRGDGLVHLDTTQNMALFETSMRKRFESCQGLSDEMTDEGEGWVKLAADLGDLVAMNNLLDREKGSVHGFDYAHALWRAGSANGLAWLAGYYSGTVGTEVVAPDPVRAYAYTLISTSVTLQKLSPRSEMQSRWITYYRDELAALGGALSPLQMEEALHLAKTELRANGNCCFFP